MAVYKMMIHTGAYKPKRCSKKNWEPGTQNDYMAAINGITRSLRYLQRKLQDTEGSAVSQKGSPVP